MAVNDIYRIGIKQTLHLQNILTILHYRQTASADPPNDQLSIAERVATTIVPLMKAVQSSELWHDLVYSQKIWPLPPLVPTEQKTAPGAGGVAGGSLPTSVAVTITKRTQFAGRKYRGRAFIAGVPVTSESDSQLAQAQMAAWQQLADGMALTLQGFNENIYQPVLWHQGPKTWDAIVACSARTVLRNQRRRQIGKGQ